MPHLNLPYKHGEMYRIKFFSVDLNDMRLRLDFRVKG
jgi:hypothetical protein